MINFLTKYLGIPLITIALATAPVFGMGWSPRSTVRFLNGDWGSCSGVMVAPKIMLTAAHCDVGGLTVEGQPVELIRKDVSKDLMLLAVEADCPCVDISKNMPELNDNAKAIGYPGGLIKSEITGTFQGYLHSIREDVAQYHGFAVYSMNVEGGYSGGGVFDKYGYLVGIVSAGSKSLMLGPNLKMIKEFLANVGQ